MSGLITPSSWTVSFTMLSVGSAGLRYVDTRTFAALYAAEIRGVDLQYDLDLIRSKSFDDILREVTSGRMVATCVSNVHDVERIWLDGRDGEEAMLCGMETLRFASHLSISTVRFYFGCPNLAGKFYGGSGYDLWNQEVRELALRVAPLIDLADRMGIRVLIEPHPRQSIFSLDDLAVFRSALSEHDLDVRLAFDPANLLAGGLDPLQYLVSSGMPEVVHLKDVQIADTPTMPTGLGWRRYGSGPFVRFRSIGDGQVAWHAIARHLGRVGFRGHYILELEDATLDSIDAIRRGRRHYNELFESP